MSNRFAQGRVRTITVATDVVLINVGFWLAYLARYQWQWLREVEPQFTISYFDYLPQQILLNVFLIIAFSQSSVWQRRRGESWLDEVYRIGTAITASFTVVIAYQFFARPEANSRLMIFWAALFVGGLLALARLLRRGILGMLYRRGIAVDHVLVIGSGEAGRGVIRTLLARPDLGYKAVGFLDDGETDLGSRRIPYLGSWRELEAVLAQHNDLHSVFIALPAERHEVILHLTQECLDHDIRAQIVPDLLQLSLGRVQMSNMAGLPVLNVRNIQRTWFGRASKRLVDLGIVTVLALPALLLTAVIALAIYLDDGGPVFYPARRIGKGGKAFSMIKFRSMVKDADKQRQALWQVNEADGPIFKIKDDPRLTRVGRVIRRLSLDEVPQLYNIATGQMSFVGPRPPIQDEVDQYEEWHHRRLDVKGGLTGLWQISGRADLTFDEACLLDIYYIENWSLALDLRIVLQTIPYILSRRGAY